MQSTVLPSTLLLTVLLAIGLVFFIRASVKDRTQILRLVSNQAEDSLLLQLQQYFDQRAYQAVTVNEGKKQIAFEGKVRPSLFLAIFLTILAAIGILCLALVLATLFPRFLALFVGTSLLSPLVGVFYWRRAGRTETVLLQVDANEDNSREGQTVITVTAHRDELAQLQRSLPLEPVSI
jgi:Flp pilus assembly protein TadB